MRERSATTLIGPSATPSQVLNGQLTTCLHACWTRLEKLQDEYPEGVLTYIRTGIAVRTLSPPMSAAI